MKRRKNTVKYIKIHLQTCQIKDVKNSVSSDSNEYEKG